jgi:hypothetical protein
MVAKDPHAAEAESMFILEPLPALGDVIRSFFEVNPLLLLAVSGLIVYLLVKMADPFTKYWTAGIVSIVFDFYTTGSLFYSALFFSGYTIVFFMVYGAMHWDAVKSALGIEKARILSGTTFLITTWVLMVVVISMGAPGGPALVLAGLVTSFLWWTYYSLEPATN